MVVACMTSCNPLLKLPGVNSETAHHWNAEELPGRCEMLQRHVDVASLLSLSIDWC